MPTQSGPEKHSLKINQLQPKGDNYFYLVDVSDTFYFFCSGEGERGVRGTGMGGGNDFIENPRGGVSRVGGGGAARGWEGVCGEFGEGG